MVPTGVDDVAVGSTATLDHTFTAEAVERYADLVDDHAPVHCDDAFARARGFDGRIVHGLFVGSLFSGLLGQTLPGPRTVLNTVTIRMHAPARVGDAVRFTVTVHQVSKAVGAVVLKLSAVRQDGVLVADGTATCSFPRPGA